MVVEVLIKNSDGVFGGRKEKKTRKGKWYKRVTTIRCPRGFIRIFEYLFEYTFTRTSPRNVANQREGGGGRGAPESLRHLHRRGQPPSVLGASWACSICETGPRRGQKLSCYSIPWVRRRKARACAAAAAAASERLGFRVTGGAGWRRAAEPVVGSPRVIFQRTTPSFCRTTCKGSFSYAWRLQKWWKLTLRGGDGMRGTGGAGELYPNAMFFARSREGSLGLVLPTPC